MAERLLAWAPRLALAAVTALYGTGTIGVHLTGALIGLLVAPTMWSITRGRDEPRRAAEPPLPVPGLSAEDAERRYRRALDDYLRDDSEEALARFERRLDGGLLDDGLASRGGGGGSGGTVVVAYAVSDGRVPLGPRTLAEQQEAEIARLRRRASPPPRGWATDRSPRPWG